MTWFRFAWQFGKLNGWGIRKRLRFWRRQRVNLMGRR